MQINQAFVKFLDDLSGLKRDRKNYEYYFRGHSDEDFTLLPSIYRTEKVYSPTKHDKQLFIESEHLMFREIISKSPNDFINEFTTIEKLVKMQHYGLPTRLLDITSNPLVALYFACDTEQKADGEVIVFRIPKKEIKFYDSDTVSVLSNIAKMPSDYIVEKNI